MKEFDYITVDFRDRTTVITINRPNAHNALNAEAHEELAAVFDEFTSDDNQWVAIITGAGNSFCAGHDLKQQAFGGGMVTPPSGFGGLTSRHALNKPVIAAVNGGAFGGGFEIVLACDLVVADRKAVFALPEPLVGLAALAGGLHRLPRAIGLSRAMDILLTGRRVSAEEGHSLGFVHELADGNSLEAALAKAEMLCNCSPMSLRATKEAIRLGSTLSLDEAIKQQWDFPEMVRLLASEDAKEGPLAFTERRKPVWKNR